MTVNLVPRHRRQARSRRRRGRGWMLVALAYGSVLAATGVAARLTLAGDGRPVAGDIGKTRAEVVELNRSLVTARSALAEERQNLDAARALARQPDWSVPLAVAARALGEEVALNSCRLVTLNAPAPEPPAGGKKTKPEAKEPPRYALQLSGFGRTPRAVSDYAQELEQSGLFERVSLLRTARDQLLDKEAVLFQMECVLKGRGRILQ
jgi:hypothetical protein